MKGISRFIASYMLNDRNVWNQRLDSLENYLKRMSADEKKNNRS
jgi:putative flippase GtrA